VLLKFRSSAESSGKEDFSAEQQSTLSGLFDQFEELNHSIESKLHKALNNSRETLASATRQRKAEDGYNVLENPDISYFQ
jgi:hypothetical protein